MTGLVGEAGQFCLPDGEWFCVQCTSAGAAMDLVHLQVLWACDVTHFEQAGSEVLGVLFNFLNLTFLAVISREI